MGIAEREEVAAVGTGQVSEDFNRGWASLTAGRMRAGRKDVVVARRMNAEWKDEGRRE